MSRFEEDDDIIRFSWMGFFAVTGFCCFLFSFFMKLIDETNLFPFITIGFVSLTITSLLLLYNYFKNRSARKVRQKVQSNFLDDEYL